MLLVTCGAMYYSVEIVVLWDVLYGMWCDVIFCRYFSFVECYL